MMKSKKHIGTISGIELLVHRQNKLNRNDGVVKSGSGYHKSDKIYNRNSKNNRKLRQEMNNSGRSFFCFLN